MSTCGRSLIGLALCVALGGTWALELRIASVHSPYQLVVANNASGNLTVLGSNTVIFDELGRRLNFTAKYVLADRERVAKVGQEQAVTEMLIRGQADVSGIILIESFLRSSYIDSTTAFGFRDVVILMPYPKESSRILAPAFPFQPKVWCAMILSFLTVIATVTWFEKRSQDGRQPLLQMLLDKSMLLLTMMFSQGGDLRQARLAVRLVVAAFSLGNVVLLYAYSGNLISYLTVPRMMPYPTEIVDIPRFPELRITLDYGSVLTKYFMAATEPNVKPLGDSLRQHPDDLYRGEADLWNKLKTGRFVTITADSQALFYIDRALKENNRCTLAISGKDAKYQVGTTFGLTKGSPYKKMIDKELLYYREYGLVTHIISDYLPKKQCLLGASKKPKPVPIRLVDLSGAFIVLAIGIGLSLIAFIAEKIVAVRRARRSTNRLSLIACIAEKIVNTRRARRPAPVV